MKPNPPRQLRLIIETDDFDSALRFYRDILGMPEQVAFASNEDGDRVAILHAGIATIELATPTHARNIDIVEGAPPADGVLNRIAIEVDDTSATVASTETAGVPTIAAPVHTPFRSMNARILGPDGWQVTIFQELQTLEERATEPGFATDTTRGTPDPHER